MKVKEGFMLREVAGQWVVVPLGERVVEFNGIMSLSESGAFLWKLMEKDVSEEDLIRAILAQYIVDEDTARADVHEFIETIRDKDILSE